MKSGVKIIINMIMEIRDRARRTETRLTMMMESQGIPTRVVRPSWRDSSWVWVPSHSTSIGDILSVIPKDWNPDDEVVVKLSTGELCGILLPKV